MKIYTKTGDKGQTGLFGGGRVSKDSPRIEAFGTIDELNCLLGLARTDAGDDEAVTILESIQQELFAIGTELATPDSTKNPIATIGGEEVGRLESWIDRLEEELPELRNFILPGGSRCGARLHLARSVCRRAERNVIAAGRESDISANVVIYLNRLSDLLFVLARYENHRSEEREEPWKPRQ